MEVEEASKSWRLKYIRFPPIHRQSRRRPQQEEQQHGQEQNGGQENRGEENVDLYQRNYQIIMQDENGPCSLIALCNILILQDKIQISPPDQDSVSYDKLAALVADYLISSGKKSKGKKRVETNGEGGKEEGVDAEDVDDDELGLALGIIPKTRYGLDVNVQFSCIDGFKGGEPERALFRIAGIPLLHGWIATKEECDDIFIVKDQEGKEEELDYDTVAQIIAQADSLVGGMITSNEIEQQQLLEAKIKELNGEQQILVNKGKKIFDWIQQSATQLTYPGLFSLSEYKDTLNEGEDPSSSQSSFSLCALYRNHHISVLYRRPSSLLDENGQDPHGSKPVLFTLATDVAFIQRKNIVWESLEDVDGSASSFYDENLVLSSTSQEHQSQQQQPQQQSQQHPSDYSQQSSTYESDLAMAQRLQQQEYQSQPPPPSQRAEPPPAPPLAQHLQPQGPSSQSRPQQSTPPKRKNKKNCIVQ